MNMIEAVFRCLGWTRFTCLECGVEWAVRMNFARAIKVRPREVACPNGHLRMILWSAEVNEERAG